MISVLGPKESRSALSLADLLEQRLSTPFDLTGERPLAVFIRVPSWLGNAQRHPENCEAPLDLGYCAALARTFGYRSAIIDMETGVYTVNEVGATLVRERPAVLVVSGITPSTSNMLAIARQVKDGSPATVVVAVGQQADAVPESLLFEGSPVDVAAVGEYDDTVAAILDAVKAGAEIRVPGTRSFSDGKIVNNGNRGLREDLDALPFPCHRFYMNRNYFHLHPMQALGPYRWGFVQSSRGCPYPCIYCSRTLRTSFGRKVRIRSSESVVEELRYLERLGVNVLVFTDDVFTFDRERVLVLCDAIARSGVRTSWKAEGRVEPADLELFTAMRKAGCSTFSMGVETGSPRMLKALGKKVGVEQIERAFHLARQAGLLRVAFFMVGCPDETEEDFRQTLDLMKRLDPDMIQVAFFTCYPGSEAHARYCRDAPADWSDFQHYEIAALNQSRVTAARVRQWQKKVYREFLFRPSFVLRYLKMKHINLLLNFRRESFLFRQGFKTLFLKQ